MKRHAGGLAGTAEDPQKADGYAAAAKGVALVPTGAFDLASPGVIRHSDNGAPHGGRMLFASPVYQSFDSLAVDSDGNICIATLVTGGITVISPAGRQLDFVECPDPQTTNICFGGADLCTAFVTLGGIGELVAFSWPRPGLPLNFLNRQAGCRGWGVSMSDKASD